MTGFSWVINKKDYTCQKCVNYSDDERIICPHCLICRHAFGAHITGELPGGRFAPELYKEKEEDK